MKLKEIYIEEIFKIIGDDKKEKIKKFKEK